MTEAGSLSVRAALKDGISRLSDAHVPSHALAAELLLIHTLNRDRAWIYSHSEAPLKSADVEKYFALIARRAAGEPTQYLTGKQEFWGLEFEVNPSVLIPRPETEHVVEVALKRLSLRNDQTASQGTAEARKLRIADVGTGSGCIAVALAQELPNADIVATDISQSALQVARRNALRHSVADQIHFIHTDLLADLVHKAPIARHQSPVTTDEPRVRSRELPSSLSCSSLVTRYSSLPFDLIVSNPPYVARDDAASLAPEVREHEPAAALFGGPTGTEIYDRLIEQARMSLARGGSLVLELGYNSAPQVRSLLENPAWRRVDITDDLAGIPRVIAADRY